MGAVATRFVEHGLDEFKIIRTQDCKPILERAKAMSREGLGSSADMKLAAEIPMIVVEQYMQRTGITFAEFSANQAHIKAVLNDPDLSGFRIWNGRI